MNFLNNEKGVSEVVGALLIFLILVVILGTIQVYEVPKWNKELERQHFDIITSDFLNLRSNLELIPVMNRPLSSDLHMGVKYPERFMLRNPGGGAPGTLTYERTNVTLNFSEGTRVMNSTRIYYKLNGLSDQPTLVYENGLIIRDFGNNKSLLEGSQTIISGNDVIIPIFFANPQSVSGLEPESLSILPAENIPTSSDWMNITLETKYPYIWQKLNNDSNLNVKVNISNNNSGKIYINRSALPYLSYPINNSNYSSLGLITTKRPGDGQSGNGSDDDGVPEGPTDSDGANVNNINSINRINIPRSGSMVKFAISNLTVTPDSTGKTVSVVVTDKNAAVYRVQLQICDVISISGNNNNINYNCDNGGQNPIPNKVMVKINDIIIPELITNISNNGFIPEIDFTNNYNANNIIQPNTLIIGNWDDLKNNQDQVIRSYFIYMKLIMY